jgi:hypothetical protein
LGGEGVSSTTTQLVPGRLYALSNAYELNGVSSFYPTHARGFSASQSYLALEDGDALLQGGGLTEHQEEILGQLDLLLHGQRLALMFSLDLTRIGNATAIAARFGVHRVYQPLGRGEIPGLWLEIRPEADGVGAERLRTAAVQIMRTGQSCLLGAGRRFEPLSPPVRLLPNHWIYDVETKTLMTTDVFAWVTHETDTGQWVLTDSDPDPTTYGSVRRALLGSRYWWLDGARTDRMRSALAQLFESREIEIIAPDNGSVLWGRRTVARHYQLLDEVLARAQTEKPIGLEVGRWRFEKRTG